MAAQVEEIENPGRGDDRDGTDYIGELQQVLNKYLPEVRYAVVALPNDPPTPTQKTTFWGHITRSIDAGYGIVMNWVVPFSNRPIGQLGSASPNYRSATTWHYVTLGGYKVVDDAKYVWVIDSGFQPSGYWITFDQCASLIPPKGYCWPSAATLGAATPSPAIAPAQPVPTGGLTVDVLSQIMDRRVSMERYAQLLPHVLQSLRDCGCDTVERRAMWFAQIGHESGGLRWQEEIADGSAYNGRSDLGNVNPGDGPRYKGRDFVQVTGRFNYKKLSEWAYAHNKTPSSTFFVDNPHALATDEYAFVGVTWYWSTQRPLNDAADARDLERATRYVNGGLNGIDDRRAFYKRALAAGPNLLDPASMPESIDEWEQLMATEIESMSIYAEPNEAKIPAWKILQALDAHGPHEPFVESQARAGEPDALRRVARTAAGKGKFGTLPSAVNQATKVLADISGKTTDEIRQLIQKGSLS